MTKQVKDGDQFQVGDNIHVKAFATPCHTQDSICFLVEGELACCFDFVRLYLLDKPNFVRQIQKPKGSIYRVSFWSIDRECRLTLS